MQKPHSTDAMKRRHIQAGTDSNAIPRLLLSRMSPRGPLPHPSIPSMWLSDVSSSGWCLRRQLGLRGPLLAALYGLGFVILPNGTHFGPPSFCVLSFSQLESHRGSGVVSLDTPLEAVHPTLGPRETPHT